MKTFNECIPCIITQGIKISKLHNLPNDEIEKLIKEGMQYLINEDFSKSPPQLAKKMYEIINRYLKTNDPYKGVKEFYNKEILKIKDNLKDIICRNKNQFLTAIKLIIAGNIIDFGAKHSFDKNSVLEMIAKIEHKKLAIDDSNELLEKISTAKSILYIGDNCGEIVFDKIFIGYLKEKFPKILFKFGVRGKPVINDATMEDVYEIGIDEIAEIISNGDGAPGTVLEDVSLEFKRAFEEADLIIAKGQGNYETLNNVKKENLFLLFMAKCDIVANELNVPKMSLVCQKVR